MIQFTVKHEQKIDCGGGYVKVFPADLTQTNMHGDSQYYIMFGGSLAQILISSILLSLKFSFYSNYSYYWLEFN